MFTPERSPHSLDRRLPELCRLDRSRLFVLEDTLDIGRPLGMNQSLVLLLWREFINVTVHQSDHARSTTRLALPFHQFVKLLYIRIAFQWRHHWLGEHTACIGRVLAFRVVHVMIVLSWRTNALLLDGGAMVRWRRFVVRRVGERPSLRRYRGRSMAGNGIGNRKTRGRMGVRQIDGRRTSHLTWSISHRVGWTHG